MNRKPRIGSTFSRKRDILSGRLVLLLGIAFGVFFTILLIFDNAIMPWYTKHGEALAIPAVVAQRFDVAKETLKRHDLIAVKIGEKNDSNLPFGYVVEQNPKAERLVKKGRRVYLTISVGEREIEAPKLIGLSETNALERIKSFGLQAGEVFYQFVPNELPDVVIEQSAMPKERVKASERINITVSLGSPTKNVVVPRILGNTFEVAKRIIEKAGLQVGEISYRFSDDWLPNTVIEQSIEEGENVKHGRRVDLLITASGGL